MNSNRKTMILLILASSATWLTFRAGGPQPAINSTLPPSPSYGQAVGQRTYDESAPAERREGDPWRQGARAERGPEPTRAREDRAPGMVVPPRPMDRPPMDRPPMAIEQADRMGQMLQLIRQMERVCFEPSTAGLIAAGGLKDEIRRPPADIIEDLEDRLAETRSLGLRNAIRMGLKDIYRMTGNDEMALRHLRQMLAENDLAIVEGKGAPVVDRQEPPRSDSRPEGQPREQRRDREQRQEPRQED